jgi:hypothetical protein
MTIAPIYQEIYHFLASAPTHEQILAYRLSDDTQMRVKALLDLQKHGMLSADHQAELDEFEQVEHFIRMLKLHTRQLIK